MYTLAVVVFFAAIFCFFAQEFGRLIKKILAIPGVMLVLPLALASWLVYAHNELAASPVFYVRELLKDGLDVFIDLMPKYDLGPSIALIVYLTLVSVLPVYAWSLYLKKRSYRPYPYPYMTSTFIWFIAALLLLF